ncbi:unnamed protein product, partial [Mesorhabditis belari]|uniref:Uncharacterized protein n=1 Tax=Mesorhabditis belari TaxID=2138241 RepID=A0AAF3EIX0_9BILA
MFHFSKLPSELKRSVLQSDLWAETRELSRANRDLCSHVILQSATLPKRIKEICFSAHTPASFTIYVPYKYLENPCANADQVPRFEMPSKIGPSHTAYITALMRMIHISQRIYIRFDSDETATDPGFLENLRHFFAELGLLSNLRCCQRFECYAHPAVATIILAHLDSLSCVDLCGVHFAYSWLDFQVGLNSFLNGHFPRRSPDQTGVLRGVFDRDDAGLPVGIFGEITAYSYLKDIVRIVGDSSTVDRRSSDSMIALNEADRQRIATLVGSLDAAKCPILPQNTPTGGPRMNAGSAPSGTCSDPDANCYSWAGVDMCWIDLGEPSSKCPPKPAPTAQVTYSRGHVDPLEKGTSCPESSPCFNDGTYDYCYIPNYASDSKYGCPPVPENISSAGYEANYVMPNDEGKCASDETCYVAGGGGAEDRCYY